MELCIKARVRTKTGKSANRQIRLGGEVSANLVMPDKNESMVLAISLAQVRAIAKDRVRLVSIEIEGVGVKKAYVSDLVWDNLKDRFLHVDFLEVSDERKVTVKVPLFVVGDQEIRSRGGIFVFALDHIEVLGFASDIPGRIKVDASKLQLGDFITVTDLEIPETVEVITDKKLRLCEARATKVTISKDKDDEDEEEVETTEE